MVYKLGAESLGSLRLGGNIYVCVCDENDDDDEMPITLKRFMCQTIARRFMFVQLMWLYMGVNFIGCATLNSSFCGILLTGKISSYKFFFTGISFL